MGVGPSLHSLADRVEIAPGVLMPRLGIGTYKSEPGVETHDEVGYALSVGYRGIDTAALYNNEESVGHAVRESGIPRDELFVATKVWNSDQGYDTTLAAFDASLRRLALDYVDLYLIHWPMPKTVPDTWRAMEHLREGGLVRAIGVCNFLGHHFEDLLAGANVPPAVNQLELHPLLPMPEVRRYCAEHSITVQAWAPIARGRVFDVPEIVAIGERHGKTAAQVAIRWILQSGVITIPKSVHPQRIAENADVFDFELSAEEMAVIDGLEGRTRLGPDPDAMARVGTFVRAVHPNP